MSVDDADVVGVLLSRLEDHPLPPEEADLLLGAMLGADELDDAIGGHRVARPKTGGSDGLAGEGRVPAGAYIKSITVEGFRGIGTASTLDLEPGPGLTVVCGRNGSGKSSFAEALEVLLTGGIHRLDGRSAVWKDGWRSLHAPAAASVSAELLIEGFNGPATVTRDWSDNDREVTDARTTVTIPGEPRSGLERLGWEQAMVLHRPFLSHAELEVMFSRPADLYDQLNDLLGLEELGAVTERLATARREQEAVVKLPRQQLPGLQEALSGCGDPRAATASELLYAKKTDLGAVEALTSHAAGADQGVIAVLSQLAALTVPDRETVESVTHDLRNTADNLEALYGTAAGESASTADLLDAALDHYQHHGPEDCPVCGNAGALDEAWKAVTVRTVERLRAEAAEVEQARKSAAEATARARRLLTPVPQVLLEEAELPVDVTGAASAWQRWHETPVGEADVEGLRATVSHLEERLPDLCRTVHELARSAEEEYTRRQDRWAPLAASLAAWCEASRKAETASQVVARIKKVEAWLKEANHELRNQRLQPFVDGTVEIWSRLRQQSNVDLLEVTLASSGPRRSVDFRVSVDGDAAAGLGVMSQGEVNALALSVFLPRATASSSPLRFVVIDDPVQAMDPSKVDGLARVLSEAARDRQVIVFTHDDRLPAAIRNLDLAARLIQVTRHSRSVVEVEEADDPADRYVNRAGALAAGDRVPDVVAARVVPGICRSALEAVCIEVVRRRRLRRGDQHESVEAALRDAHALMHKLALALFDDATRAGEVLGWLNKSIGGWAATTVQQCNKGAHGSSTSDMKGLVGNTRKLVARLRESAA